MVLRPLQRVLQGRCVLCELRGLRGRRFTTGAALGRSRPAQDNEWGSHCPYLTLEKINPRVKRMEYAERGPVFLRAAEIEKELLAGANKPFDEVIRADVGDPQALGQIPITFFREVIALVSFPPLMSDSRFASDAKEKAKMILEGCRGGSVGAYTDSPGLEIVRRHVAEYIERRDAGVKSKWRNVVLGAGASDIVKSFLRLLVGDTREKKRGIMVPIPQYPVYSSTILDYGMWLIGYHLDENNNWGVDIDVMQKAYDNSVDMCDPLALVIINPGNPTGQVLTRESIKEMVKFAKKNKLVLIADEVYQDNVYAPGFKFHSLKKVMYEMGPPHSRMELASFMSCSKGYMGECGMRGGYVELNNFLPESQAMFMKFIATKTCASVIGQTVMDCVVKPPRSGDPSYEQFACEKGAILRSLAERGSMVADSLSGNPGMTCNPVQGAMYAFPRLHLPEKAVAKAKGMGIPPDTMYALELLEATGVCTVPGSGFGQKKGTYHFRTNILRHERKLKIMLDSIRKFQEGFMKKYE